MSHLSTRSAWYVLGIWTGDGKFLYVSNRGHDSISVPWHWTHCCQRKERISIRHRQSITMKICLSEDPKVTVKMLGLRSGRKWHHSQTSGESGEYLPHGGGRATRFTEGRLASPGMSQGFRALEADDSRLESYRKLIHSNQNQSFRFVTEPF